MAQIDEIISLIEDKGDMTIDEISVEIEMPEDEVETTLREAEIKGLIYRKTIEDREVYKL